MHTDGSTILSEHLVLDEGILAVVRNVFKKNKFTNFSYFLDALQNFDKVRMEGIFHQSYHTVIALLCECQERSGMLARDVVYDTSLQFGLPLTDDMLGMMMTWCTVEGEVPSAYGVAYEELVKLMDWRTPIQRQKLLHGMNHSTLTGDETTIPAPRDGTMDVNIDTTPLEFDALLKTDKGTNLSPKNGTPPFINNEILTATGIASAMEIKSLKSKNNTSYMCYQPTSGVIPTDHWRSYGVPTIRTDLPAPLIRRTDDTKVRVSHRAPALLTINNFSGAISGKWAAVIHPSPI